MDKEKAFEFYMECMKMDLNKMLDLISSTSSVEEKNFYTELFNYVLRKRQKELVENGVF